MLGTSFVHNISVVQVYEPKTSVNFDASSTFFPATGVTRMNNKSESKVLPLPITALAK